MPRAAPTGARRATAAPTCAIIGGPRGYERTDDRMPREYFVAICTSCGNQAQVPFKPRMDKPVYCSDCFRQIRPD